MAILLIFIYLLVALIGLIKPKASGVSEFELERRGAAGDRKAREALKRDKLLKYVEGMRKVLLVVLGVLGAALAVSFYGLGVGLLWVGAALVLFMLLKKIKLFGVLANNLYGLTEKWILKFVKKFEKVFKVLAGAAEELTWTVNSKEELVHVIKMAGKDVVGEEEKKIMLKALELKNLKVEDAMTKLEDIISVDEDEVLGPVVLDRLYKSGQSCFLVVEGKDERVVGVVEAAELMDLSEKKSPKVKEVTKKKIVKIDSDESLEGALRKFAENGTGIMLVLGEEREVEGVINLTNVTNELLGEKKAEA